jgi:serine O-acetyltransferase
MIFKDIYYDVKAVLKNDPAARNFVEVLLLYQGVHALIWHRFAHWFYRHRLFFIARLISQISRFFTLIEIHPGAQLGHGILIDHGCGVVIGETTVMGDNCTLYQGVTLGGVGTATGKRHPTLGNGVTVYAGAKILGAFEVGDNCVIAANAVLLKPLEDNVTAVGIPARPVKINGVPVPKEEPDMVPMESYCKKVEELEAKIAQLQKRLEEGCALLREDGDATFGVSAEGQKTEAEQKTAEGQKTADEQKTAAEQKTADGQKTEAEQKTADGQKTDAGQKTEAYGADGTDV